MNNLFDPIAVGVFVVFFLIGSVFIKRGSARLTPAQVQALAALGSDPLAFIAMPALLAAAYVAPKFPAWAVTAAVILAAFSLYRIPYRLRTYWAGPGRRALTVGTSLMTLGGVFFVALTAWRLGG